MAASTAPAVANWNRSRWRHAGLGVLLPAPANPGSTSPIDGGTGDVIGLTVELFLGGAWTDISPYVRYADKIVITRGAPDETSTMQPQTCALTIDNRDGRFSPRNPLGPYYGQIGRNTPIRVSRLQNGIRRYRFYGEVPSWPSTWDITGAEVHAPITASGPSRRLFQGNQPLKSTFYRVYSQGVVAVIPPAAYWPAEDGTNSTAIASGLPGGTAMTLSGQAPPTFASNTSFVCSAALPLLAGSVWNGAVPQVATSANVLRFLLSVPATGAFDGGVLARLSTAGTVARLDVIWNAANGGYLSLNGYNSNNATLFTTTYITGNMTGKSVLVSVELTQSGGNVQATAYYAEQPYLIGVFGLYFSVGSATVSGTIGAATQVQIDALGQFNDTAVGHVIIQPALDNLGAVLNPFNGYLGEAPAIRFRRLCGEQNVTQTTVDSLAADITSMGFQTIDTFTTLIQEPANSGAGLLFESRDQNALVLRIKGTLYNQAAKLTLDYSQHQLSGPLDPVDDDARTRNDVTVTRINGSSVQQQQTSGTLSIQPPPAGVGDYSTTYNLSLGSDAQLGDQAGWRLHLGTVDQPRFPVIPINLRHSTFTSNLDMMNAALTIDIGDRLVVTNPPPWMPPDPISQIVLGYTETLGRWEHDIVFTCAPEDPYRVGLLDDTTLGRIDTDSSTLGLPAATTDTTLAIATTGAATGTPPWTITAADFPMDVAVGGERVTLNSYALPPVGGGADPSFESGVSGWTTTGTVTVAQSLADHYIGSASGLVNGGSTGSGFLIPTGNAPAPANTPFYVFMAYKLLSGSVNVQFYIQWFTPAGGGNGTSVIGNPAATNSWNTQSGIVTSPANTGQAYTGLQLSGSANFQLYVDYFILQNLVTGQVFNVTRSVNGVVKAQTAGTDVRLWQPMYLSM